MSAAQQALVALAAVAWLARMSSVGLVAARLLQIEEYEDARFVRWSTQRAWLLHRSVVAGAILAVAALVVAATTGAAALVAPGWLAASAAGAALWAWPAPKRALVFTARMRRVLAVAAALTVACAAAAAVLLATGRWLAAAILCVVPLAAATGLGTLLLVTADQLLRPVERGVRTGYVHRARARIAAVDPRVVAVAGSYGKTSTKHILAHLLGDQVETLPTRKSFNTLMGVTRVINEDLEPRHRLFVVEMDAYAPGEIAAMCELVHPELAVVTAVGPQHLERFGSMERIEGALYETVAALPATGSAFIHAGEAGGAALSRRAARDGRSVIRYGFAGGPALDVSAGELTSGADGSSFRWSWPEQGLVREVVIPLLGRHQVLNVTVALAVVHRLGFSLDAAVAAAASLRPVEHRLELMRPAGAVRVIDDSYNANPVGVHDALDVLASMPGGARLLVTPGLVELGIAEEAENRRYGEHAARVCDQVIVVRARPAAALCAGLRAGGLAPERLHVAADLQEASALIARLARPGDTVLFANDLPDTYLAAS